MPCCANTSGGGMVAPLSRLPHGSTANQSKPRKRVANGVTMGATKLAGRKRHILVDTEGNLLTVVVHGANVPDRAGA